MADLEKQNTEEDGWKKKYFNVLMEHDNLEKDNEDQFNLFYKELVKSFSHFRGRDSAIDKIIADLPKKTKLNEVPVDLFQGLNRQIAQILDLLFEGDTQVTSNDEEQLANIADKANDLLSYLIEQLPIDITNELDMESISTSLSDAKESKQLREITDSIKTVISDVLIDKNKNINELSQFLENVAIKINGLQSHIKEEQQDRHLSADGREELSDFVGNNFQQIKNSVAEAQSIEVLQSVITSSLDKVGSKVATFIENETQRANKAEKSSAELEEQLKQLESQSSDLRSSLEAALKETVIDPLTGVSNRRAYDHRFQKEFSSWQTSARPLTLAIMDIDNFKTINDTYGHPVGDKVLKVVAERIQKKIRKEDFFGRIGGEEFALILTNTTTENAFEKVEALRKSVKACKFNFKKENFKVSVSIGLAMFNANDTRESIYSLADQALVKAKRSGRDQTLTAQDL